MRNPILNATLNLTQACNLQCSYCFTRAKTGKRMPLDLGKRCIDFLLENARLTDEISLRGRKRKIGITFWKELGRRHGLAGAC